LCAAADRVVFLAEVEGVKFNVDGRMMNYGFTAENAARDLFF
jgi:hypothetical protein